MFSSPFVVLGNRGVEIHVHYPKLTWGNVVVRTSLFPDKDQRLGISISV
jgi:hypothetical protein